MATNLFKQAAAYRKKHPKVSQAEAVKICARKNKPAAKKKAAAKKRSTKKVSGVKRTIKPSRKIKFKIKPSGGTRQTITIGRISLDKVSKELTHQHALESARNKHKAMLTQKGLKPAEKAQIRRDIKHYTNAIQASKRHVSALKRSI